MILLIIPGWKQTSKDWKLLNDKLEYKLQSSVIDIPGFGIEPLIDQDWDITDYSNWVRKRIETEYKNEDICLIGHSFGGKIACEIASNQPEWLKLLIIISSPLLYRPNLKTKVLKSLAKISPTVIKNKFQMFSSEDYRNVKGTSLEKIFKKSINLDQTEQLKNIDVKTVLIWGEKDEYVPRKW